MNFELFFVFCAVLGVVLLIYILSNIMDINNVLHLVNGLQP